MATSSQPQTIFLGIETADGGMERLRIDEVGPVFIGRDQSCHVVLPSPEVSRRHVALKSEGGRVRLTDRSANGTFVGEQRKRVHNSTVIIGPGVPFMVGPYRLQVLPDRDRARARVADGPIAQQAFPDANDFAPSPDDATIAPQPHHHAMAPQPLPHAHAHAHAHAHPEPAPDPRQARRSPSVHPAGSFADRIPQLAARSGKSSAYGSSGTAAVSVEARRRIHRMLLDHLDLAALDRNRDGRAGACGRRCAPRCRQHRRDRSARDLPAATPTSAPLIDELTDEALGLGPLEQLLADEAVTEIMVVDPTDHLRRARRARSS